MYKFHTIYNVWLIIRPQWIWISQQFWESIAKGQVSNIINQTSQKLAVQHYAINRTNFHNTKPITTLCRFFKIPACVSWESNLIINIVFRFLSFQLMMISPNWSILLILKLRSFSFKGSHNEIKYGNQEKLIHISYN